MVKFVYNTLTKFTLNSADAVLTLNSNHRDLLINQRLLKRHKLTFQVHNLVDNYFFNIKRIPREIKQGICISRLETYQKAINRLVPVFEKFSTLGINFILIGEGDYRNTLELIIKKNRWNHVKLTGFIPHEELHKILREVDFFLMPSRYETQPVALLEAMASGLPIIASNILGINEFCTNESSILVEQPDDPNEWVCAILYLINNPDIAFEMGLKAREHVKLNKLKNVVDEHLKIYKYIIDKNKAIDY